jgi:structural maintenance of chromosome 3 (chondroitin sulfate proteoglycan 6)
VVVENDDKSTEIIKHLNQENGGRVTFIPLNRVRAPNVTYPQRSDVTPLIHKLNFKDDYTPAFRKVSFYSSAVSYLHMGYMAWYLRVIC